MTTLSSIQKPPFLPPERGRTNNTLIRACTIACMAANKGRPSDAFKGLSNSDPAVVLTKAASTPAVLSTSPLAAAAVSDFFVSMGAVSAFAAVKARGLEYFFDGGGAVTIVPNITASAGGVSFVGEQAAIPVRQLSASSLVLWPRKAAVIVVLNRELFAHSGAEQSVKTTLLESTALQIDTLAFDNTAGDTIRPPGLRYGVNALNKSASSDALTAMIADLGTITGGVRAVAANNPVLVVMSPDQAQRFRLRMQGNTNFGFELFATSALADGTILAIASNALASALSPVPRIETSIESVLVMDDAPTDVVTGGTAFAGGVKSMFQTDAVSLRLTFDAYWGLRSSSGIAWITGITAW